MQTKLQKQYIAGSMPNFISNIKRVLDQFSIFVPPDNVRKPLVFWLFLGGIEMRHWAEMD